MKLAIPVSNSSASSDEAILVQLPGGLEKPSEAKDSPDPIYSSVQFHGTDGEIRLIELLPGQYNQTIQVRLFTVNSVIGQPYEALSYVWGSREHDVTIDVDGIALKVSLNLANALRHLRPLNGAGRILWADALCINQASNSEKASQVALMGQIYRAASDVVIYLGEEANDSDLVMTYLEIDDPDPSKVVPALEQPNPRASTTKSDLVRSKICLYGFDEPRLLRAAHAFFARPYWARIWVVQEFGLAWRPPKFYCGERCAAGEHLHRGLAPLLAHLTAESDPLTGDPAVSMFLVSKDNAFTRGDWKWNINFGVLHSPQKIGKQERPSSVMLRLSRRQSTDPRDKVFAMRELVDPAMRNYFLPDYETNTADLFATLSTYVLTCADTATMYSFFPVNGIRWNPSWTLNLTEAYSFWANGQLLNYEQKEAFWMRQSSSLSIYSSILGVAGTVIDVLDTVVLLDDTNDDMHLMKQFWDIQWLLRTSQPSEPLSKELLSVVGASDHVVPLNNLICLSQCLNTAVVMPGTIDFSDEVADRRSLHLLEPMNNPSNLTCDKWQIPVPLRDRARMNRLRCLTLMCVCYDRPDAFLSGAIFDLENLLEQIASVELSENVPSQSHNEPSLATEMARLRSFPLSTENDHREYGYPYLFYRMPGRRRTYRSAEAGRSSCNTGSEVVNEHMERARLLKSSSEKATEYRSLLWGHIEAFQTLSRNCTCSGSREQHQHRLKLWIDAFTNQINKVKERRKTAAGPIRWESKAALAAADAQERKLQSAIFTTRHGFVGIAFQRDPGIKAGDRLVVLDGFRLPLF